MLLYMFTDNLHSQLVVFRDW